MTALTDISDIINRMTGGNSGSPQTVNIFKDGRLATGGAAVAPVIGAWSSLWQYVGSPPNGAIPSGIAGLTGGNASVPTYSVGLVNPGANQQLWLLGITATSLTTGTLILYDRLLHCSGLNAMLTGNQVITGAGITRYTGGTGNRIWTEIYSQIGATKTSLTVNYVDTAGNLEASQTADIGNTEFREAQRILPVRLASGDIGVQNIQSVILAASTTGSGNFGVNVVHPLCYLNISAAGVGVPRDFITGLPTVVEIQPNACLAWAWYANTVTVPQVWATLNFVSK